MRQGHWSWIGVAALAAIGLQGHWQLRAHGELARTLAAQQSASQLDAVLHDPATLVGLALQFLLLAGAALAYAAAVQHALLWVLARQRFRSVLLLVGHGLALLLLWWLNARLFPESSNAPGLDLVEGRLPAALLLYAGIALMALLLLAWAVQVLRTSRIARIALLLLVAASAIDWLLLDPGQRGGDDPRPDLIIVGIDSLRPDVLPDPGVPGNMPFLQGLVAASVAFEHAYTPFARTYPAWMSLLSGQFPPHNGVRDNLYPRAALDPARLLSSQLQARGYQTLLAMDDVRFANFDRHMGFDLLAGPPAGLVDIVNSAVADHAHLNLLSLLPLTRHLLYATMGNRAAHAVYRPEAFSWRLRAALRRLRGGPAFIAAHFCLPHWPYTRVGPDSHRIDPDLPANYQAALAGADRQIERFWRDLRDSGRLQNAVVVFMSDHGESFGLARDGWIDAAGQPLIPGLAGHGSSVLAYEQHHVLLAVQRYGAAQPLLAGRRLPSPVALPDIATTLWAAAGAPAPWPGDGFDLLAAIDGRTTLPAQRAIPVETGMLGAALLARDIEAARIAGEMAGFYALVAGGRLELTAAAIGALQQGKQRGVYLGQRMLAHNPRLAAAPWQAVDRATRRHAAYVSAAELPADWHELLQALCAAYRDDPGFPAASCPG